MFFLLQKGEYSKRKRTYIEDLCHHVEFAWQALEDKRAHFFIVLGALVFEDAGIALIRALLATSCIGRRCETGARRIFSAEEMATRGEEGGSIGEWGATDTAVKGPSGGVIGHG